MQQPDYQSLLIDDIHPNDAGHRLVADALLAAITIPGDANGDGLVDATDATILAANWQAAGGAMWTQGDFNGDGSVNEVDATILAVNWKIAGSDSPASVPEPTLPALLLSAVVTAMLTRL